MIGQTIKHYQIVSRLGAGGMGEVFLATDTKLGRKVALKFLPREFATDPERRRRLELEATAASSIDHPNILTLYEINDFDGQPFIAMAYVDGETLKEKLSHGRLPLPQAMRYAIQIASALAAAHAHGIVHRDVKPDNILIGKDDRARLTDFGLAKMRESSGLTSRGVTVGTVGYMSPEQAQGFEVDARSDIFSLGVILYEMFAGRLPFSAEHAAAALYSIVHETPTPVRELSPDTPEAVVAVVDRCLAKKPEERYTNGAALEADLRAVARSMEISHISSGQMPVVRRARPHRLLWGIVGVAAIIIGLALVFGGSEEEPKRNTAVATENTLAVLNFENLSDPNDVERQGDIIAELLTTDLSASQFVNVISSQRLYDLSKQEGVKPGKIDRGDAIAIAKKAGATRMLAGAISKLGDQSIITAQLVDVSSGDVVGAERVNGTDLFTMVDSLSLRIKRRLGLSESQVLAGDVPISDATTSSPEAYRAYLQGMEHYHALDWDGAQREFDRAIQLDSTFALAYLRKAIAYFSDGRQEEGYKTMALASRYIDRVPTCDRFLVQALAVDITEHNDFEAALRTLKRATVECPTNKEPFFWIANFSSGNVRSEPDTAILYARKALELDPDYPYALFTLCNMLIRKKNFDAAHEVAFHYRDVRPNDVYPYELLGDIHRQEGMLDSARAWYAQAVRIAPDQRNGYRELARIFVLQGQADSAIEMYSKTLASDNDLTRNLALRSIGNVHAVWGRFDRAAEYYRKAASMAQAAHLSRQEAGAHMSLGQLYLDARRPEEALREFVKVSQIDTITPQGPINECIAYCYLGESAKARAVCDSLDRKWKGKIDSLQLSTGRELMEAGIALHEQRYQEAVDHYSRARRYQQDSTFGHDDVAQALIGLGRYNDALKELALLRKDAELDWPGNNYMRGLYLQADALVKSGRPNEAVEPLQRLMVFWGNTDWDIPWLDDARKLYASLTAQ